MYQDEQMVREFLAGEYRSASALTMGTEEVARMHQEGGDYLLAEIHRLPIDRGRELLIYFATRYQDEWCRALELLRRR